MINNHRYCVIMCGGIGSRFWPYSRTDRPKQFIDFSWHRSHFVANELRPHSTHRA